MKPLILVTSGDVDFYLLLNHILDADGFDSFLAEGPEETLHLAVEKQPDAIVLDCQPGQCCGAKICTEIKQNSQTDKIPVVALISSGAENQYVELLKAGVNESFIRPVAPAKLLDFLRTKLVRDQSGQGSGANGGNLLNHGDIEMSLDTYRVRRNGTKIHLGPIEFKLLRHLLQNPGQVFSRDELISAAWPGNIFVEMRTVDVHMGRLRKSLKIGAASNVIRTVRSAGYALDDQLQ